MTSMIETIAQLHVYSTSTCWEPCKSNLYKLNCKSSIDGWCWTIKSSKLITDAICTSNHEKNKK